MQSTTSASTPSLSAAPAPFAVSDAAYARIAKICIGEPAGTYFRIEVKGGGCSGYQYDFRLDTGNVGEADLTLEKDGKKVVIDDISLGMLEGGMLDYTEDLGSAGFEIKNPNAKSGCGCGNSFSV